MTERDDRVGAARHAGISEPGGARWLTGLVRRLLASSRYFVLIAVLGASLGAAASLVYSGRAVVAVVFTAFRQGAFNASGAKVLAVQLVGLIDLLLLGTVLYLVAVGLHKLVVDSGLPVPRWLRLTSLEDLEALLLSTVVTLLADTFLGEVVIWDGEGYILAFGLAVGLVLGVLGLVRARGHGGHGGHGSTGPAAE